MDLLAIKLVVFSIISDSLKIFLLGSGLPTRQWQKHFSPDLLAKKLFEETIRMPLGVSYIEQLYTFAQPEEKPSQILVTYYALVPEQKISIASKRSWQEAPQATLPKEDRQIVDYAISRLRGKVEYTNIVYSFLPKDFTLSELQRIYEVIIGQRLDKRNFRKKILSLDLLKTTGKKKMGTRARPATVYAFKDRSPALVKIIS